MKMGVEMMIFEGVLAIIHFHWGLKMGQ